MPKPTKVENKTYEHLRERQQALVDEIALARLDNDNYTAKVLVERAAKKSGHDEYHPSIVSRYKDKYSQIIEERMQVLANDKSGEEGEITTIGTPLAKYTGPDTGIDLTDEPGEQTITDRPVKKTGESEDEDVILIPANSEIAFKIIRTADEDAAEWIFNQLMGEE